MTIKHVFHHPEDKDTGFIRGPINDEAGGWTELDFTDEFWSGDTPAFRRPPTMTNFLDSLPVQARHDALRALRSSTLRVELYALDGSGRQDRPYTVTEFLSGVREEPTRRA